jgi:hypothetical protein
MIPIQDVRRKKSNSKLPNFRKSFSFVKVPSLRPFVLLVRATFRRRRIWGVGGMILTARNGITLTEYCPSATLSTKKLKYTDLASNLGMQR